jgi:CheY-like chemotaxis protein
MRRFDVLLVEDDPVQADVAIAVLTASGSLRLAAHAGTVARARSWLELHDADVVLLDYDLPDGTAADLTAWMRNVGKQVPALLLTSRADAVEIAGRIGASAGLRKDGNWPGVVRRLEDLAATPSAPAADATRLAWTRALTRFSYDVATAVQQHTLLAVAGPAIGESPTSWVDRLTASVAAIDAAVSEYRVAAQPPETAPRPDTS